MQTQGGSYGWSVLAESLLRRRFTMRHRMSYKRMHHSGNLTMNIIHPGLRFPQIVRGHFLGVPRFNAACKGDISLSQLVGYRVHGQGVAK